MIQKALIINTMGSIRTVRITITTCNIISNEVKDMMKNETVTPGVHI
jgi:hypothetical protein